MKEPLLRTSIDDNPERRAYSRAFTLIGLMGFLIAFIAEARTGFRFHHEHAGVFALLVAIGTGFLIAGLARLGAPIDSVLELHEKSLYFTRRIGFKQQEVSYSRITRLLATSGNGLLIVYRPDVEWLPEQSYFIQIHNAADRDLVVNTLLKRSSGSSLEGTPLVPFPVNVSDRRPLLAYVVIDELDQTQSWYPIRDQLTVGREPGDGHIGFPKVSKLSRNHFRFSVFATGIRLTDLASTNGTVLNGKMLDAGVGRVVEDGDVIQAGGRSLKVRVLSEEKNYWLSGAVAASLGLSALMISESTFGMTLGFAMEYAPFGAFFWGLGLPALAAAGMWAFFKAKPPVQRAFLVAGTFLIVPFMGFVAEYSKRKPLPSASYAVIADINDARWGFPRGFLLSGAFDGGLPFLHFAPRPVDRYALLLWRDSQRVASVARLFAGDFTSTCAGLPAELRVSADNLGACFLALQDILLTTGRVRTESGRMALTQLAKMLSQSGRVGSDWDSSLFFTQAALRHLKAIPRTFEASALDLRPAISYFSAEEMESSNEVKSVMIQEDRAARGFVAALHSQILERLTEIELRSGRPDYADRAHLFRSAWMEQMSRRMSDEAEIRTELPDDDAESLAQRVVQIFRRLNGPVNRMVIEWDTHEPGRGFLHRIYSRLR